MFTCRSSLFLVLTTLVGASVSTATHASEKGKFKVNVKAIAFIPDNKITPPKVPFLSDFDKFHGDGHDNFQTEKSARQFSSVTVDLSGEDPPEIVNDTGTTRGFKINECVRSNTTDGFVDWLLNARWQVRDTQYDGKVAPDNSGTKVDSNFNNTAIITLKQGTNNPLFPGSPNIDYEYKVILKRIGCNVEYTVTGNHDGYPAHDIVIGDSPVYGFNPGLENESTGKRFINGEWKTGTQYKQTPWSLDGVGSGEWDVSSENPITGVLDEVKAKTKRPDPKDPLAPTPAPAPTPPAAGGGSCPAPPAITRAAYDPNDMSAIPAGFGPDGHINPYGVASAPPRPEPISFLVRFENLAEASANADTVEITTTLDPMYDFESLRVNAAGTSHPDKVCIRADPVTRKITWTFREIDLPPNVTAPEGAGFARYDVRMAPGLATGTSLHGAASIVFDANPPILTNVVTHTVDVTAPVAQVSPLPAVSKPTFVLHWTEQDTGAGVDYTEVYFRQSGGTYALLTRMQGGAQEVLFRGEPERTYEFFAIGVDRVGNREVYSALAEASTTTNDDVDLDDVPNTTDNCPGFANPDQSDLDGDGDGDLCDKCAHAPDDDVDFDEICDNDDNCLFVSNHEQNDADGDGVGDACEAGCASIDADGDGANACDDCNDAVASVHPGAPEICDIHDNDCNGWCNENLSGAVTCVTVQRGTFGEVADTDIAQDYGTWAAGAHPTLATGFSPNPHRTLTRFDLSFIPQGSTVVSASAKWYALWSNAHQIARAHRLLTPWSEAAASWANYGSTANFDPAVIGTFDAFPQGFKSIDLTAYVASVVSGAAPNHGVVLESDVPPENPGSVHFYLASESSTVERRPRLEVCYAPACDAVCSL